MKNTVTFDGAGNILWEFSKVPEPTWKAQNHFQNMAANIFNKPKSLRSEKREQELEFIINNAIRYWTRHDVSVVLDTLAVYLHALLDWGDKSWAESVIDKFNSIFGA